MRIMVNGSPHCDGNMHRGWFLQSVQVPPLHTHRITDFQDVDPSTLLCPESDNGHGRITKDIEFRDLGFDPVDNLPSSGDYILC